MISSGVLYVIGDITAQVGIEERRMFSRAADGNAEENAYDVSS